MLSVTVSRSSSDDTAICYVLPVEWMIVHNGANGPDLKTTRMFRPVRQMAAPKATSAVSDCIFFELAIITLISKGVWSKRRQTKTAKSKMATRNGYTVQGFQAVISCIDCFCSV